ncbi:hypothetical protein ACIBH1_06190 [Nonomuraea sp. NPDC050663]|uniref:hypothetical protein n=1 Tax=Nonomuraea sp. NPDC050663 TaxID=3364370 RepID=UPI00379B136F
MTHQAGEVQHAVAELKRRVAEEERDVAKLESGFSGFLAGLTGTRDEKLTRERAEARAAWQLLAGESERLADLLEDLAGIERELGRLGDAYVAYPALLAARERDILERDEPNAARLAELGTLLTDVGEAVREHDEARQAGLTAQREVAAVLKLLDSARSASGWDVMGGGLVADAFEHDRLKQAERAAWKAQRALDLFARELADLGIRAKPTLPEVDTRWFVDTFFDNIITDAMKHDRIKQTRRGVQEVARWAERMLAAIVNGREAAAQDRLRLLSERERLLVSPEAD